MVDLLKRKLKKAMVLSYVLGTFYWRNWTITSNLRANFKIMLVTGRSRAVPMKTCQYVIHK